ncbi:serine/threonine receptor-like kinase NFP [Euphorbia lathyris]|uniref:serine/threonine receptor-like kinase NFP n=1 Tax=Euphorbia lathyris TaxID=212925 RepID=UPI003313A2C5
MAISLLELLFLLLLSISTTYVTSQSPEGTNYSCSTNALYPCQTYVSYFAQPPIMMNLGNISDLFGVSRLLIASASNLHSEDAPLIPNQLLLVPITCGCTGNGSFASIIYRIKHGDSFYTVSTALFQNLTTWQVVQNMNPSLDPTLLHAGDQVNFPLFCMCASNTNKQNGIQHLITYVWQPDDDVFKVAAKLNASALNIVMENSYSNFTAAVHHPVVIPVSQFPILSQPSLLPPQTRDRHPIIVIVSSVGGAILVILLVYGLVYVYRSRKKKKTLHREISCLEKANLLRTKELKKHESFEPKIIHDKLFSGVSSYLCKPIVYEVKEIMKTTRDLHEHYRIGGSVYRANIDGQILAVKKAKEDVTEQLKILQKVSHANLVKLMGISSDADRVCFLVYEYAENGSLDKWLHPKSASSSSSVPFLSWSQRLHIALDVASGLQYMHEHIQPSIVHMDIRTSNILLDSRFKAKIANFSVAKLATDSMLPKVDVFAFGVVLLELLCGKKAMVTKDNGEIVLLWKEVKVILEIADHKVERLKKWIDPNLENFYPIDSALSLANLAQACTSEKTSARPSMAEIVFHLTVFTQSSSEVLDSSWTSGLQEEVIQINSPLAAR